MAPQIQTFFEPLNTMNGSRLQLLMKSNFNLQSLRANGPLLEKEQQAIDTMVIKVAQERLTVTSALINRGLSLVLDNPLGHTEVKHHTMGELAAAQTGMEPRAQHRGDAPAPRTPVVTPNPLTWIDFQLSAREVAASQNLGTNLDLSEPEAAARQVGEQIENIVINGGGVYGGNTVYGIVTAPNRSTFTFESNHAWDNAGKTGADILADVQSAIALATADNMFGPFLLLIPEDYNDELENDYGDYYRGTIRERLLAMQKIADILPAGKMPADTIALVQPTSDVIRLIVGDLGGRRQMGEDVPPVPITVVFWEEDGGFGLNFKIIADVVPQIKSTSSSQSGVVIGTPS